MKLPEFKYFPDPIKAGSIEASEKECECCSKKRGYIYTGTMYTPNNVEALCPWCIHDGSASKKYDGFFNCFGAQVDKLDDPCELTEEAALEVSSRTPGFASFQEEEWQVHCNDGCEFHGIATTGDFQNISKKEEERLMRVSYLDKSELDDLKEGDSSTELNYFFKFKCRHCGEIKFMMDLD
jgi:uncharacterized protein CbrC (UPF0167 family)